MSDCVVCGAQIGPRPGDQPPTCKLGDCESEFWDRVGDW